MLSRIIISCLSLFLFLQCRTDEVPAPVAVNGPISPSKPAVVGNSATASLRVLFVGNSLTYSNDLPSLVVEIAAMDGVEMSSTMIAHADYAIEDHLSDGDVQKALKGAKFNFVVAQQGPSALPESQVNLREFSIQLAHVCEENSTALALFMVWPSLARDFDREACIASYTNAARASKALLCPAGLAWKKAWARKSDLPLYSADNFHPGLHGSVLAAMVIYGTLQSKKDLDFIDLKKASFGGTISEIEMIAMKAAAMEALEK
jgi:hypothetical protein